MQRFFGHFFLKTFVAGTSVTPPPPSGSTRVDVSGNTRVDEAGNIRVIN